MKPQNNKMTDNNLDENKPIKTAIGIDEQIELYKDKIIIRNKGLSNILNIIAEFKPSDVKKIMIKPAGTLYNGRFEMITKKLKYAIEFKSYQQHNFEDIKIILGK